MKKSLLIHPEELNEKWIARAASLGCHALLLHPAGGKDAHLSLAQMIALLEEPSYRALLDRCEEAGLSIGYAMHTARYLLPAELFNTHPEYFRMNQKGERVADFNFCPQNTEALALYAENAAALAKKLYKSGSSFYFWLDDIKDAACHCEKCRALTPSDQQLLVMNEVVKRLRREIPDARVPYLAYAGCISCPKAVQPEAGIFLEYAPIERDFTKEAKAMPEEEQENIKSLLAFFGKEQARVLEYWFDNSLFSKWKKPPQKFCPDHALIKADIGWYRALGFEDIASFACFLGKDYEALFGEPDLSAFL